MLQLLKLNMQIIFAAAMVGHWPLSSLFFPWGYSRFDQAALHPKQWIIPGQVQDFTLVLAEHQEVPSCCPISTSRVSLLKVLPPSPPILYHLQTSGKHSTFCYPSNGKGHELGLAPGPASTPTMPPAAIQLDTEPLRRQNQVFEPHGPFSSSPHLVVHLSYPNYPTCLQGQRKLCCYTAPWLYSHVSEWY